jgi:hypothetical protein
MRVSCKSCKNLNDTVKKTYEEILNNIEFGPRIITPSNTHDFKCIEKLVDKNFFAEFSYKTSKSIERVFKKFSIIYYKNEIDSSVNNLLDVLNIFYASLNKVQLKSISLDFLILACFFLIMRSKYNLENTNEHFKFFHESFDIQQSEITTLLQIELLIFYSFGYVIPKSPVVDIFFTMATEYFHLLKIIQRKRKRGTKINGNSNCFARQAAIFHSIKFYCFLFQEHIELFNMDVMHLYFLIFYTIINKLNEIEGNAHYSISALFILLEKMVCDVEFDGNDLNVYVNEYFTGLGKF